MMHNSLDILPAIKHLRPDLTGLDVFFRSAFTELQNLSGGETCVLQTDFGAEGYGSKKKRCQGRWLAKTADDKGFKYPTRRSSWLLWGKTQQSINSSTSFALPIIKAEAVSRGFSNPANLTGARALRISELLEV